ncbi:integrase arm-type DNA-binding domain-containing protein, partial [Escherichia coli]|nr:integrase arm-type DNA-binding domain-containing protein [Escherichia coli]
GDYPELSLEDARNKASEYRKLLVKDIDPQDHLKNAATQGKVLFRDVAERWFVEMIYDVEQENIANKIAAAHKRARDNGLKKASDLEVADLSS